MILPTRRDSEAQIGRECMEFGKDASFWQGRGKPARVCNPRLSAALLFLLLAGCAANRSHVDRALLAGKGSPAHSRGVAESYTVHCPDVLQVAVADRPDLT